MAFRFVHTADLHLDSPLRSLAMRDEALAARVDTAAREAFEGIVTRCLEERVDALMIAGDLYDGEQNSVKTGLFLARQLARLSEAGIRTFIVRGNHDARSRITPGLELPPLVHVFDGRGRPHAIEGTDVIVHGVSFADERMSDSLLPKYAAPTPGAVEIGLMHTSLGGDAAHDDYAPCALAELCGHGFAYWGLGHVHSRNVHHEAGNAAVVMAGMPQGRDVGEGGEKSATLVTIEDDGSVVLDRFPTAVAAFARADVPLVPEMGWDEALDAAESALLDMAGRVVAPHLVARLEFEGASRDAWRLRRDADDLLEQLRERIGTGGDVYVEKVAVRLDATERKARSAASGPLDELRAMMEDAVRGGDFAAFMDERARQLSSALKTRELRDLVLGASEEARTVLLADLAREGLDEIGARLEGRGKERAESAT